MAQFRASPVPALAAVAVLIIAGVAGCTSGAPSAADGAAFLHETFDDANLAGRGWYDQVRPHLSPDGTAIEYRFDVGAAKPAAGAPLRRKFGPANAIYFASRVRYSPNWVGSGRPYHPHEFYFLTTRDGDWSGLSFTHLTLYVEENGGVPLVSIQDGRNVDQARVNTDLTQSTERRAVAGCNGSADRYPGHCYRAAEGFVNEKTWRAPGKLFDDDRWHLVEVYVRLNSIAGGKGVPDGIVQYWFDGRLVIDHSDVLFRTADNASMQFNQLVIAPYIGDGSPVAQTFWIDDLTVARSRP